MKHGLKLPVRTLVAAALVAATVYVLVRVTDAPTARVGRAGVGGDEPSLSPFRGEGRGEGSMPAPPHPFPLPGGERGAPLPLTPSLKGRGDRGAPAEGTVRAGPVVPEDAWIEIEVEKTTAAEWKVSLAESSEGRPALELGRTSDGRFLLSHTGGNRIEPVPPREAVDTIRLRRRGGDWTIWLNGVLIAHGYLPGVQSGAGGAGRQERPGPPGKLPGVQSGAGGRLRMFFKAQAGPSLKRPSVREIRDPAFTDDFMREGPDETWTALGGVWELAGIRFPERSANPFALFARFPGCEVHDPFIEYRWQKPKAGIGVNLSSWRGMVQIERITGNGPAAEAGVREHDIVLSIDGADCLSVSPFSFFEDLEGPVGSVVNLTILRPGELRPRSYSLKRRRYRWARETTGQPITGSPDAKAVEGEKLPTESLAVTGEPWWDGYRYEASVALAGAGGAGLAFAVRDAGNYHCFAAVGDTGDAKGTDLGPNRLVLFRVREGERTALAEREWGALTGTYYRLVVDLEGERIRTFLDGARVFDLSDRDLPAGRIGCWAFKGAGAHFDDVAVSTDRSATAPPEYTRARAVYHDEIDMRVWANPADEWEPDPESDWWWNRFRFPGTVRMNVSPRAKYEKDVWGLLGARSGDPESGVRFVFGGLSASISHRTAMGRGSAIVQSLPDEITVEFTADGEVRGVRQRGSSLLFRRVPRAGDAVAMRGLQNLDEPGVIRVTSSGVKDYYFRRAPVDWAVAAGKWGILNKWICDPRFSWFGGHSRSLALVWNKNKCGGDVTLDFYAALVMIIDDPPYERVGDFNCTILGDGRSLSSGYTLVVSGGRNSWARLYGGGKLLAESRDAADRLPSNVIRDHPRRFLHQRWFRITLERVNGRVRYLFDGREVFDVPDTLGIESGYCGLFTQDNGMLVARARIAATAFTAEGAEDAENGTAPPWGFTPMRQEIEGLTNLVMGEVGTRLELDGAGPSGAPAVKVTNARTGGAFAVAAARELNRGDLLAFDFRAEGGAKVDLYLMPRRANPGELGPYRVRLTGPEGLNDRHPVLAGPLASADGEWHHVEIHPRRLFESYIARRVLPRLPRTARLRPVICNLEEGTGPEYLPCGIGGNAPGASYWISGLRIEDVKEADREPPRVRRILFPGEEETPPGRVLVEFEDDRSGVDGRSILIAFTRLEAGDAEKLVRGNSRALRYDAGTQVAEIDLAEAGFVPERGGTVMVEVREYRDRSGRRGEPTIRAWRPEEMTDEAGPELVGLEFLPRVPGEVDLDFEKGPRTWRELRKRLGGEAPVMSLDRDTPSGEGTSLRITAVAFKSDCIFRVRDGPADLARLLRMSFDYRLPPQTPVNLVVLGRKAFHGVIFSDVHDPVSEWSHRIKYAGEFEAVRTDGEWHRAELDLAGVFRRAYPHQTSYIIGGMFLCDWGWNGLWPGDGYWLDNLRIEGVRRGKGLSARWRAFDCSSVERAAWVLDTSPETEPAPTGEATTDEHRVVRTSKGPDRPGRWTQMTDMPSDIRVHLCSSVVALPAAINLPDGPAYFHLRLADGRGNWSRTFHKRLLLDNTPPRIVKTAPADGASSPALEIAVTFDDYSGVDPLSLRLEVAGKQYRVDGRACRFDRAEGVLRWSARGAGAEEAFAPGERIGVKLLSARDIVGNELGGAVGPDKEPCAWSWTWDPSLDTTPPPAPSMRLTTGKRATSFIDGPTFGDTNDFERELGPLERGRGCKVALSEEAAREGKRGCRVTVTPERRGCFTLRLRERYWYTDERPYLVLDYRLPPRTERLALKIDLLRGKREHEVLKLLAADGEWHRAVLDLGSAVRKWRIRWPVFKGRPLRLAGPVYLVGRAPPGSVLDIDNVEFVRRGWRGAVVEIPVPTSFGEGADESGRDSRSEIIGLSVVWDRKPDTVPPETVTHRVSPWLAGKAFRLTSLPRLDSRGASGRSTSDEKGGPWYLHARFLDGAGNWGETGHLEVDFGLRTRPGG